MAKVCQPLHFDKCTEQLMLRRRELNEVECQQRHASRSPALKGTAEASSTVRGRSSQISTSTSRISRFRERFSPDKNAHRKGLEERPDTPILSLQGRQGLPTDQTKRPKSEIFMSNQRSYASSPSGAGTSRQRPKSEVFNNYSDITPCPPARFHTSYSTRNRRQKLPAPSTSASVSQVNHAGLYTRGELSSPISNSETMPPLTRQVPPSNHPLSGLPSTMQLPKPSAMEKIKAYFKKKGYFVPKY